MTRVVKLTVAVLAICIPLACFSQDSQRSRNGRFAGMERVLGTIDSVAADQITVKTPDGQTAAVKITSSTQFRKDRQPATLKDFKAGDHVMAMGKSGSDGTFSAEFVVTGSMRGGMGSGAQRGPMGGPGMMAGEQPSPEQFARMGLGTRFIAGEVKKIEETKLTILRPDGQTQVIQADENTSFRNDKNESQTLADIKVGDHVMGRGEVKNGIFVPEVLHIGQLPQRHPADKKPDTK